MLQLHMIPTSGDATLVRFIEGNTQMNILVDGGNRKNNCVEYLRNLGIEHVDLLVASHLDEDHIRGLRRVADEVRVEQLWITDVSPFIRPAAESVYLAKCICETALLVDGRGVRDGNKLAVYEGLEQQIGPFYVEVLSPPKSLHNYLRRPETVGRILKSPKGQTIKQYVRRLLETLVEESADDGEPRDSADVVSQVVERFHLDIPQAGEIDDLIERDEDAAFDWRERDRFFESARSLFNDISIVVAITYDYRGVRKRLLFPGDLTNWSLILARHSSKIRECVLKVPHHGSEIYADKEDYIACTFRESLNPKYWKDLPYSGRRLWQEWYYLFREYGGSPFPWNPFVGWRSSDLPDFFDCSGLYAWLSPEHSLIYPYRSSFRLPRLDVRNAIKDSSDQTSCNFFQGQVGVAMLNPSDSCIDCFDCVERKSPTIMEWGA